MKNGSHLDAVEVGCSECEVEQCDGTVGYGGRYIHENELFPCAHLDVIVIIAVLQSR